MLWVLVLLSCARINWLRGRAVRASSSDSRQVSCADTCDRCASCTRIGSALFRNRIPPPLPSPEQRRHLQECPQWHALREIHHEAAVVIGAQVQPHAQAADLEVPLRGLPCHHLLQVMVQVGVISFFVLFVAVEAENGFN